MAVDYDLVIIGGSLVAREAALMAVRSRANVALVEPTGLRSLAGVDELSLVGVQFHPSLPSSWNKAKQIQPPTPNSQLPTPYLGDAIAKRIQQQLDLAYLAGQGIDVITGDGEFRGGKQLGFAVNQRLLTARRYILASGSRPWIPQIEGLNGTGYVTLDNLLTVLKRETPPRSWVIFGGMPSGLEVAQVLVRLGCQVTLITTGSQIWKHASPATIQLLQAQLEADGVEIICDTKVVQTRVIDGKKWLQVGDRAIESDEILIAIAQQPNIDGLNLAAVDVKWRPHRLIVNNFLQTTNPQIYACGDVIGGYPFPTLANYEAPIVIHNSLFFRQKTVNYQQVPYVINTRPSLAHIGLTLTQAKSQYQRQVIEVKEYFKDLPLSQMTGKLTGLCSLVVGIDGQILGASVFGDSAGELINLIALAIQQNLHIKHLANLAVTSPSYSQIFVRTAQQWREYKFKQNIFYQEFLDDFFHIRRHFNW